MTDLFIIVKEIDSSGKWSLNLTNSSDETILIQPCDVQTFKVFQNKAFLSVIPGLIPTIAQSLWELSGETGQVVMSELDTKVKGIDGQMDIFQTGSDLYKKYPQLDGEEQSGVDEHGDPIMVPITRIPTWG